MYTTKRTKLNQIVKGIVCILTLIGLSGPLVAHGAQIKWKHKPYSHYANKEDVKTVLSDFFASQGVGVICSEAVQGKVSGKFNQEKPEGFFRSLMDAYNLTWYYDGATIYVYSASEMISRFINLGYLDTVAFKENLIDLGILDDKFAMRFLEKDRMIYVVGPQRYVELISDMAHQMDAKAMAHRGKDDIVKIFPLKYAWAEDKQINFRDKQTTIQGVASLLRNLISGTAVPGQVADYSEHYITPSLEKLKGQGLADRRQSANPEKAPKGQGPSSETVYQNAGDAGAQHPAPLYAEADVGFIQADSRQNAVVVRDRKEKMPYYEEIINLLDAPVGLVEIRATIIDVDRRNMKNLGIQWEFASTDTDNETTVKGGLNTTERYNNEDGLELPVGQGLNVATIIGDATDYFLSKVHALEVTGDAHILSRPSVLTLNNVEAQLEHSQTVYVRLEGNEEVDLFDINTGVILRVTPHIVEQKDKSLIKLSIQIEDGELSDEKVDNIPIVNRSVVNTQAVVHQKESLLVGGLLKQSNQSGVQKVPCLGDIPLLGHLFRSQASSDDEYERLFLITPTIIQYQDTKATVKASAPRATQLSANEQ